MDDLKLSTIMPIFMPVSIFRTLITITQCVGSILKRNPNIPKNYSPLPTKQSRYIPCNINQKLYKSVSSSNENHYSYSDLQIANFIQFGEVNIEPFGWALPIVIVNPNGKQPS